MLGIAGLQMRRPPKAFRSLPNGVVIGKSDPPSGKCQRASNGEDPGEEHPSHTRPGKTRLHRALLCQDTAPRATEKKFVVSKCKMSSHRVYGFRARAPARGLHASPSRIILGPLPKRCSLLPRCTHESLDSTKVF